MIYAIFYVDFVYSASVAQTYELAMIDCSDSNIEKVNIVRIHSFHFIVKFFKILDRYFRLTGTYIHIEMCANHIVFLNNQILYKISLISEEYHDVFKISVL